MKADRQQNRVTIKRLQSIAQLFLLLGGVGILVGIVTLINLDVWSSSLFWISLTAVLLGTGVKLWRPVVIEPVELLKEEIASTQLPEHTLVRASELPSQPQTELLRAGRQGQETPSTQLWRAEQVQNQEIQSR